MPSYEVTAQVTETCRYCMDLERAERAVWRSSLGDDLPTLRAELRQAVKR